MNAIIATQYPLPGDVDTLSNERAMRPESLIDEGVFSTSLPVLMHGGINIPTRDDFTFYYVASKGYINLVGMGTDRAFGNQITITNWKPDLAPMNFIWTGQPEPTAATTSQSVWRGLNLQTLLAQFRRSGSTPNAERIAVRLENLYRDSLDDDESPMSLDSTENFLSFLKYVQPVLYPEITLTSLGNIYATWGKTSNSKFSLEFGNKRVKYIFFYRNNIGDLASAKGLGELPISDMPLLIGQLPRALKGLIFNNGQ